MDSTSEADPAIRSRIRQQEVVAELGQQALETDDLDQLMHDASVAVAETLNNEYAKVLELLPSGDEVFLRQGVGWRDGLVGSATVPTDQDSQAGYTLMTEEPVIVEDLCTEERFSGPELLTSHDVVSGISVIIGSVDEPWGVLGTHSTEHREFTEHDAHFVQSVANVLASAIENKAAHKDLHEIYGRISDAFFALDEEWRFTHLNERAHELINPDGRELIGKNVWEAFPAATERKFKPKYEQAMYEQETVSFEEYYPDPLDMWFEVRAYPSETGMSVYFRDVTERKAWERELAETVTELEESEERLRLALEAGEMGTWELDLQTNDSPVRSPQHDRIFGYEEPLDHWDFETFLDHVHPDDREEVKQRFEDAFETGTWEFECRIKRADGEQRVILAQGEFHYDSEGEPVRAVGVVQDITERVERARELERALDLLEKTERIADVGGWEIDVETQDVFWTDHIFELLDVPGDEEPPLEDALAMYHDEDQPAVEAAVENALDSGESFDIEVRVRTDSGEIRWLRLQGIPEIVDGEVVSFRGAAQDVTKRREREQALKDAKSQLETLFDILPVGAVVAEADGELIEANDTAHEIWGGDVFDAESVAEYDQYPVFDADTGERIPPEEMTLARVLSGEEVTDPDVFEFHAADGESRIVELEGMPIRNEHGEVVRGVVTMSDVTERWEAQRNLEKSERRYRTLVENFPNGSVGLFNEDLEYTAVGGKLLDRLDMDPDDRIGHSIRELHPPDLLSEVEPYFEAALDGETNTFEIEFSGRHLHLTTLPVRNADTEVFAGMVVVQDVTERREYERKLEESNERLEQFAYAASHDLQEPLRMVSSYLSLIERRYADELDADGEEFIEFAVDGADRMRKMIDGLLEYSRVETQGNPFEPTDLNTVLADVRDDLQVKIEENDAELTVEDLPCVKGDANQLRQVFQNLLENAVEYSGNEPPRIHVTAECNGPEWVLSVRDKGIGIDPDHTDSIFQVFERLHTNDEHEGTGIGLALCERIVERHGGEMWVDSEPGEGSTFSFTLPASDT